jgi:thiol:disulfide interchange protein DsbD
MTKRLTPLAALAALLALSAGCAEAESPKPSLPLESPTASTVFSPQSSNEPLPADEVFVPDAHIEDGALLFRIQVLPGYYLYKDKISVRSLSEAVDLEDQEFIEEWSRSEVVVDEWFGEQEVFFDEAHGSAEIRSLIQNIPSINIELSYQGCKEEGICYMPQAKVLSVDVPAQLESAADKTE